MKPLVEQMAVAYATEIEKLQAEIARLRSTVDEADAMAMLVAEECQKLRTALAGNAQMRALLKEARQYVSDAGSHEEPGEHQAALLANIDKALAKEGK